MERGPPPGPGVTGGLKGPKSSPPHRCPSESAGGSFRSRFIPRSGMMVPEQDLMDFLGSLLQHPLIYDLLRDEDQPLG